MPSPKRPTVKSNAPNPLTRQKAISYQYAGWRSAVIYSIMGTCRGYQIDPAKYLKDVLTSLPDLKQSEIPSLTPRAWAKAHPETRTLPPN
jgi:hypothetical protein